MSVVIDINVPLPSIRRASRLRWLVDALLDGTLTLVASIPVLLVPLPSHEDSTRPGTMRVDNTFPAS